MAPAYLQDVCTPANPTPAPECQWHEDGVRRCLDGVLCSARTYFYRLTTPGEYFVGVYGLDVNDTKSPLAFTLSTSVNHRHDEFGREEAFEMEGRWVPKVQILTDAAAGTNAQMLTRKALWQGGFSWWGCAREGCCGFRTRGDVPACLGGLWPRHLAKPHGSPLSLSSPKPSLPYCVAALLQLCCSSVAALLQSLTGLPSLVS